MVVCTQVMCSSTTCVHASQSGSRCCHSKARPRCSSNSGSTTRTHKKPEPHATSEDGAGNIDRIPHKQRTTVKPSTRTQLGEKRIGIETSAAGQRWEMAQDVRKKTRRMSRARARRNNSSWSQRWQRRCWTAQPSQEWEARQCQPSPSGPRNKRNRHHGRNTTHATTRH